MAAEEVIHFPFGAQLPLYFHSEALFPPQPVAEPPPIGKSRTQLCSCSQTQAIRRLGAPETGEAMPMADLYTEIYLWNLNIDRLIRVLQRLEPHSIRSQRELKAYAIRLEEIRAGVNADFAEVMVARERADEFRFWAWRTALEQQTKLPN